MKTMKVIAALSAVLLCTGTASGQDTLGDAVKFLMTNQGVPTGDVARDNEAAGAVHDAVARALLLNLTSAPLGTSSGGFLYRLNPELGTVERVSQTFGTFLVDRAVTGGLGSVSLGMTGATAGYDRLNGYDLRDGSFVTVANRFRGDAQPFDTESLTLRLRTSTMMLFASVGVDDNIELGIVVPIERINLEGERLNVYRGTPVVQATAKGSASGLGDIAVRAKYGLFSSATTNLAATGEVRLPTGNEENLLGAGSLSWRLLGVASFETGPIGLHANGGIVRGGLSNETLLAGALAVAVHPRATFTTEVLRRQVSQLRAFEIASAPHPSAAGVDTLRLVAGPDGSTLLTVSTGVKWNVTDTLLLNGQILWALNDRGLTAPMTPIVGLEYSIR